jgi:hypothetical protein
MLELNKRQIGKKDRQFCAGVADHRQISFEVAEDFFSAF